MTFARNRIRQYDFYIAENFCRGILEICMTFARNRSRQYDFVKNHLSDKYAEIFSDSTLKVRGKTV